MTQLKRDLRFTFGAQFSTSFTLYSDTRMTRWRGTWSPFRIYELGESVEWEGTPVGSAVRPSAPPLGVNYPPQAYIATLRTEHSEPGAPGSQPFWSPMRRQDLTGAVVTLKIDGVLEEVLSIPAPTTGEIPLNIAPAKFATAPSSANYSIKVVDATAITSFPVFGTALFRQP